MLNGQKTTDNKQTQTFQNITFKRFQKKYDTNMDFFFKISALDGNTVIYGVITLIAGVSFRVLVSYFSVLGGELNLKERIFVALAWLPKATVQVRQGYHDNLNKSTSTMFLAKRYLLGSIHLSAFNQFCYYINDQKEYWNK